MAVKVVVGTKEGKCLQKEIDDVKTLYDLHIGQTFKGEKIDFTGYEFQITGGSDVTGVAMRKDIKGNQRAKILAIKGVGLKKQADGKKVRKAVCGGTIGPRTSQINLKVIKQGPKPLFEEAAKETSESEVEAK